MVINVANDFVSIRQWGGYSDSVVDNDKYNYYTVNAFFKLQLHKVILFKVKFSLFYIIPYIHRNQNCCNKLHKICFVTDANCHRVHLVSPRLE
jgi:hypothetical protein